MKLIDRFTRDDVSAKIWWPLALVGIVALVLTVPAANRAAEEARADRARQSVAVSRSSIEPQLKRGASSGEVSLELSRLIADDPVWTAARVWAPRHILFASSERSEQLDELGSAEALNDDALSAAVAAGTYWLVTDRLSTGDPGPTTFHAYTTIDALNASYVTEFEARDATLLADVHRDWLGYRIVAGVATLLLLTLALFSMREPIARIGGNVPFYPESLPANQAVIDAERAVELEQAGGRAHDRVAGLQQRLEESERLRMKAEADLQQALTGLGTGGRTAAGPRPQRSAPVAPATPRRQAPTPTQPAVAPPVAPPAASPRPVPAPAPAAAQPAASSKPAAVTSSPARRKKAARPAADPAAPAKTPPPPVTAPAPAAKAPPAPPGRRAAGKHVSPAEPVTVSSDEVSVTAPSPAQLPVQAGDGARDAGSWPEVVILPEPEATSAVHGPDSDEDVLDVLHRLVPDAESPQVLDDPGDLRARLARTAALKKPGSRERQQERGAREEPPQQ